jgi:cytochrome c oxidase cbb3-type subunit III
VNSFGHLYVLTVAGALLLSGCNLAHGKPGQDSETVAPAEITDFATLYAQNCAGCHGAEGRGGAAGELADPVYLAIADDAAIQKAAAGGIRGTAMPGFAQSAGGMLTDKQIDAITNGIRSHWSKPGILEGSNPPSYFAKSVGNAGQGALVFKTYCGSCHGPDGRGGTKGSAVTNDVFLALVSDQSLRTVVIAGRPELGAPDWRGNVPGKPMSEQEITDVVAWLASHRAADTQQTNSTSNYTQH